MMEQILFVSKYPELNELKQGFIRRVKEIDDLFADCNRIYLDIRFFSYSKKICRKFDNVTHLVLNWFFHFFLIIKLLNKSKLIYIHSVYSGFRIFPHIFFSKIKRARVCIDLHGTFPEELEYKGEKWNAKFFGWVERKLLKRSKILVFVTKKFEQYYLKKYPFINEKRRFVITTCPSKVFDHCDKAQTSLLIQKYNISSDDVVFIYSGSTEIWQKIDLIMQFIQEKINKCEKFKFFLLTANVKHMKEIAEKYNLYPNSRIHILSVEPEELCNYYEMSHYGFVLRDDHILNEVASPTKLLEYLIFGIIPIMKSTKIGDFIDYDIDFVNIDNLDIDFSPVKSEKNITVAKMITKQNIEELKKLKEDFLRIENEI